MSNIVTGQVKDMPKIHAPFKRHENEDGEYVVYNEINGGYEWVFENDDVIAVEKLHGTNVSILIENGEILGIWNRTNRIPLLSTNARSNRIVSGVREALERGYVDQLPDGQHFGELVGPKVNGNEHELDTHVWYPFARTKKTLRYKSWGNHPKTFENISAWFKDNLFSLFYSRRHNKDFDESSVSNGTFCEGIMFYHPDGRMAKLRRDMFEWYSGERH